MFSQNVKTMTTTNSLLSVVRKTMATRKSSTKSNFMLYKFVSRSLGYDLKNMNGEEMLTLMHNGKLPNFDTVARTARMVKAEKGGN